MHKLAAISVDLDEIDNYTAIHGTGELPIAPHAVYDKALPRLATLFDELAIPATFFAIGRDLARAENRVRLRVLHTAGHEVANHTLNHLYDLTRRERATQQHEVRAGADAIEAAVGVRPVGFRAPGYTITDELLAVLAEEGADYDSSLFPCPPYYLAKAAALSLIRLRGSTSHSILDTPRVLAAPADPYRIGKPYLRRGRGLLELPVGVTTLASARFPFIGTSVVMAGERGARLLAKLMRARPLVNLVLHGLDLSDAHDDGLLPLAAYQPDLRRTAAQKRAALVAVVNELKQSGFKFVTLSEAARAFA